MLAPLKHLSVPLPIAIFIASVFLTISPSPLLVTAQQGVSYVLSNDGTIEYPCEGAALAEVYYQDKCEFRPSLHFHIVIQRVRSCKDEFGTDC